MFGWLFKKRENNVEEETKKAFSSVKKDMEQVGKWIKHLDEQDKQVFDNLDEVKKEI